MDVLTDEDIRAIDAQGIDEGKTRNFSLAVALDGSEEGEFGDLSQYPYHVVCTLPLQLSPLGTNEGIQHAVMTPTI